MRSALLLLSLLSQQLWRKLFLFSAKFVDMRPDTENNVIKLNASSSSSSAASLLVTITIEYTQTHVRIFIHVPRTRNDGIGSYCVDVERGKI